nr:hypothetical protein [Tanacetum cinerariifolium]
MTSFGYRLNPRYAIKECLSCVALYTGDFCCSKGNVEDKILVPKLPKNCARCGHPVNGPYCQGCTFLRKKLEEDLVTQFQGFQNTFESSDGSTNEPCYNQNFGDNYYPQNSLSFPQQHLCCENCGGPHANFNCQLRNQNYFEPNASYNYNSFGFDQPPQHFIDHQKDLNQQRMNNVDDRWNKIIESGNKLMQFLGEMILRREHAAKLSTHTPETSRNFNYICYDDDDDDKEKTIPLRDIISQLPLSIIITTSPLVLPIEDPEDSLIMRNTELNIIPKKESDEVIKSSVEDFVPIPSESEDTSESDSECDLPSDDESLSDEDVPKDNVKIYSNPLFEFDDEYISSDVNPLFDEVLEDIESKASYDSNLDKPALLVTPLFDSNEDECFDPGGDVDDINAFDIPSDFKDSYYDSEGDLLYLESLISDDTTPNLLPEVFLDHDPRSLRDINDLKIMVKVFDPRIPSKIFSPTYVRLPFKDRHYLSLTYVIRTFLPYFTYLVDSLFFSPPRVRIHF